jgi:MSHA pilin protein MshD
MLAVAEEMMEEILLKPYTPAPGTISGCNRAGADDISDYAGYTDQPVCDIDGTAVPGLGGYTVSVAVDASATLGALASGVKKVTVTVTRGGESLSLTGWRTDYAS